MLKDSEDCFFIKRHKLSLTQTTIDTPTTTTPPITPPTPPPAAFNMMMMSNPASAGLAASLTTSQATSPPAHHTLIPSTMAATLLANVAAANSSITCHSAIAATPLALAQAVAPPPPPPTTTAKALPATASVQAAAAMASTHLSAGGCASATATVFPDHYSLRWNNHQNHILRAFDALLQTKNLVDVTLVCAETSIQAHKMVLSACSPFFQRVFEETPCKHPVIVLKDFQGWVVQAIVDFMYRGEISVPQERLQTLIQAGESLQVRGLVESSVPEHTPTPAASPDDFGMLDTSLMSSELGRCSSFDEESPSMVTAGSKVILPSRLFGASMRRERELERKRERERERDLERDVEESDQELQHDSSGVHSDVCTSPMPRRKQARPRRRSGELPHDLASQPPSPILPAQQQPLESDGHAMALDCSENLHATNNTTQHTIEALKTVIKTELAEPMDEDDDADGGDRRGAEDDSGKGNDSREQNESYEKSVYQPRETEPADLSSLANESNERERTETDHHHHQRLSLNNEAEDNEHENNENDIDDDGNDHDNDNMEDIPEDDQEPEEEDEEEEPEEDIEELINTSNELRRRRKSLSGHFSEGPEDLCTTKKDNDGHNSSSLSDSERCSPAAAAANNNNNSKLNNNNHRVVLALKDIRHLHKSSTPTSSSAAAAASGNNMHPFAAASLRDLRLDRAANAAAAAAAVENQCKMEALEAQMHAAAAAAAVAAANGENPFQHMEQQMDLSLAAACAAVSHQQSRERDHQAMRDQQQRELQHHHNAYANSLLGPMGMGPGIPGLGHFGPERGNGPPGSSAHERLEDSMNRLSKEFGPSSPMSLPGHFNPSDGGGAPHEPSPLPFSGMCSALTLTPPHSEYYRMFGMESTLGIFPPGIDPGKLYNPLMEMSDPRGLGGDHPPPFLKKKMPRPKGQHSAPRGGPPRSWTNTELTDALQHVWNKKMTTSQASRVFGIPYNSLLMYVRGKYGKSLKLEQLRRDCISGPPLELLQMGISGGSSKKNSKSGGGGGGGDSKNQKDHHNINELNSINAEMLEMGIPLPGGPGSGGPGGPRSTSSEPDLLGGPSSLFNPFPPGFYPDFPGAFPGLPLSMLNLLPPAERHQHAAAAAAMHQHMSNMDEDCKSDRSKHSSSLDEEFMSGGGGRPGPPTTPPLSAAMQPLALNLDHNEQRRNSSSASGGGGASAGELGSVGGGALSSGPPPTSTSTPTATSTSAATAQLNGSVQD